jgi:endonuclease/exonuclease/phosphatase (EEP) superfamily protein YafD
MSQPSGSYRHLAATLVLMLLVVLAVVSLLPLMETNIWWIRYLDFPRLQFAIALSLMLALYLALRGRPRPRDWIVLIGANAALIYQIYKLHPYSGLVDPVAVAQAQCRDGQSVRIMVANVKRRNESADVFLDQVLATDPDLLLIMETDAWWDERLASLSSRYRHRVQSIPADHAFYGMHLFSKLELISPEFNFFFDAVTPTVVTQVRLPGWEAVGFIGVHPKPPLAWSQSTTMRDAHLLQAALVARQSNVPTIVAGDFNAVPWERVTRRAMRIGRLLDPRVGYGLYPTYDTESVLMSWPLDQILFQPQLTLQGFDTLPDFGSDHRAVVATLCHDAAAAQRAPDLLAADLSEAEASIDAARAGQ